MPEFLRPDWNAPPGVHALMTLRGGGHSRAPFGSFNLSLGVGDDAAAVAANRQLLIGEMQARPTWLQQVHGNAVLRITADTPEHPPLAADAAWTTERRMACMVGAADCMPVLLAARNCAAVGAAHAGWRGMAAGVIEATLHAMCEGTGVQPADVVAWLGPAIGPRRFEVGADVLETFGQAITDPDPALFAQRERADGPSRWLANLPALATRRLQAAGVNGITDAATCTVEHPSRFFSYRRDGVTGRMVAAIWLG